MLYQSTCVGFGYGPCCPCCFPDRSPSRPNPIRGDTGCAVVTSGGPRNVDLVPIGYGLRPRLRGRLTLRGLALRRNPWTFGGRGSRPPCRYSCPHSRFRYLQRPSRVRLRRLTERSATTRSCERVRGFGAWLEPRYIFAAGQLNRPVSYYAFFKGWLLLSQPPGCYGRPTCFPT